MLSHLRPQDLPQNTHSGSVSSSRIPATCDLICMRRWALALQLVMMFLKDWLSDILMFSFSVKSITNLNLSLNDR